jgi:hypothetical protein
VVEEVGVEVVEAMLVQMVVKVQHHMAVVEEVVVRDILAAAEVVDKVV